MSHSDRDSASIQHGTIIEDGEMRCVQIGDQRFLAHLMDKQLTPTKGTDGSMPTLTSWELRRGFVRGLADADGYFATDKWTITDANTLRLQRISEWIPVDSDIVEEQVDERSWAYLRVSRKHRLRALYGWLYPRREHTEPAMDRKRRSALELLAE